ncbi:MAG TPA: TetR/AcrR family transcriptional regulator, partial [Solirubrobacterales bacterium]|nr:TetR/AcrR family transcriptional regulator [Solirubrobacterales bacterium]
MASAATTGTASQRRQMRERDLVAATRRLFDERGMQEAPMEEVARAVGINRGLIYRHFSSKEELFVLTVTDYLDELAAALEQARRTGEGPEQRLRLLVEDGAGFCGTYPAFIDCALSLMQRPAEGLREIVSDAIWLRLGQGMVRCFTTISETLREGNEAGVFKVDDPDYTANLLWTQLLGAMHLA